MTKLIKIALVRAPECQCNFIYVARLAERSKAFSTLRYFQFSIGNSSHGFQYYSRRKYTEAEPPRVSHFRRDDVIFAVRGKSESRACGQYREAHTVAVGHGYAAAPSATTTKRLVTVSFRVTPCRSRVRVSLRTRSPPPRRLSFSTSRRVAYLIRLSPPSAPRQPARCWPLCRLRFSCVSSLLSRSNVIQQVQPERSERFSLTTTRLFASPSVVSFSFLARSHVRTNDSASINVVEFRVREDTRVPLQAVAMLG